MGQPLITFADTRKNEKGFYQVRLDEGIYNIKITPHDPTIPPFFKEKVEFSANRPEPGSQAPGNPKPDPSSDNRSYQITLPDPSGCTRLEGKLVNAKASRNALEHVYLQILDENKEPISNTATTGEDGRFKLWITQGKNPSFFRLKMSAKEGHIHPQVDLPYKMLTEDRPAKDKQINLGNLPIGFVDKPVRIQGRVLTSLQEGGTVVSQSRLQFIGEIDFGTYKETPLKGIFQREIAIDENGYYDLQLPPGRYKIVALPPQNTDWARVVLEDQELFENKELNISLLKKYTLSGNICEAGESGSCKKISHAQVHAHWRGTTQQPNLINRPFQPQPTAPRMTQDVNESGGYSILLDPGIYDLVFIPKSNSKLARGFAKVCLNKESFEFNAFLPKAKYLVGTVMGPDGFPIDQMFVEMYEYARSSVPARLLGRAVTNAQGRFSIAYSLPQAPPNAKCKSN